MIFFKTRNRKLKLLQTILIDKVFKAVPLRSGTRITVLEVLARW